MNSNVTSSFPSFLPAQLQQLRELVLTNNFITGPIPPNLAQLSNSLENLALDDNLLAGDIQVLRQLTMLKTVYLEQNMLHDSLTGDLFENHPFLKQIDLSNNRLNGTLPVEWFNQSYLPALQILDLHENNIAGVLPMNFPANDQLHDLALHRNSLSGSIPASLSNLGGLNHLDLTGNQLTGPITDTAFASLTVLRYLFLAANSFDVGPIPTSLRHLTWLKDLSLKDTQRTGTIPTWIGELSNLVLLDLDSNDLSGTVPTELGNIGPLGYLQLNRNEKLSGTMPKELRNLQWGLSEYSEEGSYFGSAQTNRIESNRIECNRAEGLVASKLLHPLPTLLLTNPLSHKQHTF